MSVRETVAQREVTVVLEPVLVESAVDMAEPLVAVTVELEAEVTAVNDEQ